MRDDHLHHTLSYAKRDGTGLFLGVLAAKLDQYRAIDMAYPLLSEVAFKVAGAAALRLRGGFPTAHMSSLFRSTRSRKVAKRAADDLFAGKPRSTGVAA